MRKQNRCRNTDQHTGVQWYGSIQRASKYSWVHRTVTGSLGSHDEAPWAGR